MQAPGYLMTIIQSFYSPRLYRALAQQWKSGRFFLYLFILLLLCSVPPSLIKEHHIATLIDDVAMPLMLQIPQITVTNGEVQVKQNMPHVVQAAHDPSVRLLIDTSDIVHQDHLPVGTVLLMKQQIVWPDPPGRNQVFQIPPGSNFTVDKQSGVWWLSFIKDWALVFILGFYAIGLFLYRFIQIFLYGLIGLLFNAITGAELSYRQLVGLSAVALTPTILVETVIWTLGLLDITWGIDTLWYWVFYFTLSMSYLLFAVHVNRPTPTGIFSTPEVKQQGE